MSIFAHLPRPWRYSGTRGLVQPCQGPVHRRITVKKHRLFDTARSLLRRVMDLIGWRALQSLAAGRQAQLKWCNSNSPGLSAGTIWL